MRHDISMLLTRLIIGGIFVISGWTKISDMVTTLSHFSAMHIPAFLTYIVSYGELLGGVMLIFGLLTVEASFFLAVVMAAAVYFTWPLGFQIFSNPLAVLAALLAILGCGSGKYKIWR